MSRHPGVEDKLRWLTPNPNLPAHLLEVSEITYDAAQAVLNEVPLDSPQLTDGLQKLLEAKDCFVRAAILYADTTQES